MQGNPQKLQAAELMLSGMTDKAIAKKLNVDPSTVWRWRNSTPVAAVIAAERNRRHEAIPDEMLRLADDALDVLAAIKCVWHLNRLINPALHASKFAWHLNRHLNRHRAQNACGTLIPSGSCG